MKPFASSALIPWAMLEADSGWSLNQESRPHLYIRLAFLQ